MAQTAQQGRLSFLNTNGKDHPVQNAYAMTTLLLGAVAIVSSLFPGLHLLTSWVGLAGILIGGWGQMISQTTAQRFVVLLGLGAAALGFYLGMSEGGLFGGLVG